MAWLRARNPIAILRFTTHSMKKLLDNSATALNLAKPFVTSKIRSRRSRHLFDDVRYYCMFIGYPRSGHSLTGSLLDAHPNMVIAHELDALKFVHARFSGWQLYNLLLDKSREFTEGGRKWNGYTYRVPGQWQGKFETLRVIGDKKGGGSTQRLRAKPELLARLRSIIRVPIRFVHTVRNPYDNISTISLKQQQHKLNLPESVDFYFNLCETIANLKTKIADAELFEMKHETFVANPRPALTRLCAFLGEEASTDYLDACTALVFESPRKTRHDAAWTPELIRKVADGIKRYEFLAGYSYED